MKFKNIILITLILLSVLTISSVSAFENNATNEVIELENSQNTDNLTVEQTNDDILEQPITNEDDCKLEASINVNSSESVTLSAINTNESNILSANNESDILSAFITSSSSNIVLKSSKKISATATIAFVKSKNYMPSKKLKTKDTLYSVYSTINGQYGRGLTVEIVNDGRSGKPLRTMVKKVNFYYKNKKTGKYKIKTVTKIKNGKIYISVKSSLISGYTPVKAKIWYTSR